MENMDYPPSLIKLVDELKEISRLENEIKSILNEEDERKKGLFIFLDQLHLITLFEVQEGRDRRPDHVSILTKIKRLVERRALTIPLNLTNFIEAYKVSTSNVSRAESFVRFVLELSRGYFLMPFIDIIDLEAELIVKSLKDNETSKQGIRWIVLSKGIERFLGAQILVGAKGISQQQQAKLNMLTMVLNRQIPYIQWMITRSTFPAIVMQIQAKIEETAHVAEKIRNEPVPAGVDPRDWHLGRFLMDVFTPPLANYCKKYGLTQELIRSLMSSRTKVLELVHKSRVVDVYWHLLVARDEKLRRPVESNDEYDLASYSVAIPFCDCVVGEKFFIDQGYQENLHKEYPVRLIRTLRELNVWLSEKGLN